MSLRTVGVLPASQEVLIAHPREFSSSLDTVKPTDPTIQSPRDLGGSTCPHLEHRFAAPAGAACSAAAAASLPSAWASPAFPGPPPAR